MPDGFYSNFQASLEDLQQYCEKVISDWNKDQMAHKSEHEMGPKINLPSPVNDILVAAWSPNGKFIACGSTTGTIYIYDHIDSCIVHIHPTGSNGPIWCLAWSPDGQILAVGMFDRTIHLWNPHTGSYTVLPVQRHEKGVYSLDWSPDGEQLASASEDGSICIWNPHSGDCISSFQHHNGAINCIAWSPDGEKLASAGANKLICIWQIDQAQLVRLLPGHTKSVNTLIWLPDKDLLLSGSDDGSIRQWNVANGHCQFVLDDLSDPIRSLVLWEGDILIAQSVGKTVELRFWDIHTCELLVCLPLYNARVAIAQSLSTHLARLLGKAANSAFDWSLDAERSLAPILKGLLRFTHALAFDFALSLDLTASALKTQSDAEEQEVRLGRIRSRILVPGVLSLHPTEALFVSAGTDARQLAVWLIDRKKLSARRKIATHYRNAKVVLIGDTGVGKTSLATALRQEHPQSDTISSGGCQITSLKVEDVEVDERCREQREVVLWDTPGQEGYRLTNQLFLDNVTIALIVFHAASEVDPFRGVYYWARALQEAQRHQTNINHPQKRFLVAAKQARAATYAENREGFERLKQDCGIDGYKVTSAMEGVGVDELLHALLTSIDWEKTIKVFSNTRFQQIKTFLTSLKANDGTHILWPIDDLYQAFIRQDHTIRPSDELHRQFSVSIDRLEDAGLLKRLQTGSICRILLRPEMLDNYASSLIMHACDATLGVGYIKLEEVYRCQFAISDDLRCHDAAAEQLLVFAMVEELLQRELMLLEDGYCIFPAQTMTTYPQSALSKNAWVFDFEGPVVNIYSMLTVRLALSGVFHKKGLWKNVAEFVVRKGETCGMLFDHDECGKGTLTIFFDPSVPAESRSLLKEYISTYLETKAINVMLYPVVTCSSCNKEVDPIIVRQYHLHGEELKFCPYCGHPYTFATDDAVEDAQVDDIDETVKEQKEEMIRAAKMDARRKQDDYDVFFCYNQKDSAAVQLISYQLQKDYDILPWLYEIDQGSGKWLQTIPTAIHKYHATVIFQSNNGIGRVQNDEINLITMRGQTDKEFKIIPVILPGTIGELEFPGFAAQYHCFDFRKTTPDPLLLLARGITGRWDFSTHA